MARTWHNQIVSTPQGTFVIEAVELEYDYETGKQYLSDIDEPARTAGFQYATRRAAEADAAAKGIRIREGEPYYGDPIN